VPANRISEIVKGRRGITPETALRLGRYFGTGAELWNRLQADHDLAIAERELGPVIRRDAEAAYRYICLWIERVPPYAGDPPPSGP
jgi:plasmid maintenance system antidote protein VapI